MAQVTNLTINPNNLSADVLFMEVPNSLGKVKEHDYPARFIMPYDGLAAGENNGTLITKGKKTIDVVFTGDGVSPSVSLSCLNCDQTVITTNKGKVTDKVVEYLIFNGQATVQSLKYGGAQSMSDVDVVDDSGATLSAELNPKSGVVTLYKNANGARQPSDGYGSVKITNTYSATRFEIAYDAKDFRYFVEHDSFKNAFVSHNGDNLAPDFMKATVTVSGRNYVSVYSFTRKVQSVEVVVGDEVAFNDGEPLPWTAEECQNDVTLPCNPNNDDYNPQLYPFNPDTYESDPYSPYNPNSQYYNPTLPKPSLPTKPVNINPYSSKPYSNKPRYADCKPTSTQTKSCFDGSADTTDASSGVGIGKPYVFRGMDGSEYIKDKCGNFVAYNAASGKPCDLQFKEDSREDIEKTIRDEESEAEIKVMVMKRITFKDSKGSKMTFEFKDATA